MTARERTLLGALAATGLAAAILVGGLAYRDRLASLRSTAAALSAELGKLRAIAAEEPSLRARALAAETLLTARGPAAAPRDLVAVAELLAREARAVGASLERSSLAGKGGAERLELRARGPLLGLLGLARRAAAEPGQRLRSLKLAADEGAPTGSLILELEHAP